MAQEHFVTSVCRYKKLKDFVVVIPVCPGSQIPVSTECAAESVWASVSLIAMT